MSKVNQEKRGLEKESEKRSILQTSLSVRHLREGGIEEWNTCVRRERPECQTRVKSHTARM
jgi:hypothetical protein